MVWRALLRLGVPEGSVEDAVQDVFLVVHRKEAAYAGRSSLRTWIYGITLKVAKAHRRTEARHRRRLLSLMRQLKAVPEPSPSPALHAEQREAARLTQQVLSEMSEDERDVLVLVELEELSIVDAAEALELHVRTCQRRLRAARSQFEVLLEAAFASAPRYSNKQQTEVVR
jgi:RNA polymerase sigma-70 factor (ECF subfamily)